jgi:valyl-tRNA synthetase
MKAKKDGAKGMNDLPNNKLDENVPTKFLKPYDPAATEDRIYALWEKSGFFNPDNLPEEKGAGRFGFKDKKGRNNVFSIVLPPPNVTGTLHMGHAAMLAIEDIMIRYKRMKGFCTLWLPGTDHAAIATQTKVEKELEKKEKKHRRDLGREEFLRRVDAYAGKSHDAIIKQVRKMGASVDWSREAFTLDEKRTLAVRAAFKEMYDMGLIYRGNRIVNWDPQGQTTISDDEIVYEERKTKFYTFRYSKDFPISIATTRPETKVGDTAVAVNPDDERYKQYIGKDFEMDFAGVKLLIKIVGDAVVDSAFGTGAVGVTPAHSSTDADIASRHNLPSVQVIDEFARMKLGTGIVGGVKIGEARETIVKWLKGNNLLEKEEEIIQNIATAERTGGIIEPLPKLQWFIGVNKKFVMKNSKIPGIKSGQETTLKEVMKKAVESGAIKIIPERFEKIYYHWIDNLRDWCISRQIWYGHRIPVWYKQSSAATVEAATSVNFAKQTKTLRRAEEGAASDVGEGSETASARSGEGSETVFVGTEAPKGSDWIQDEDTLDTWFSSGLWTFSTLGWPKQTEDLKIYHPTSVLETGYDILFFWVARMILMTGCLLGDIPFRTVYLHGLVRDGKGRKMSKSLDNIIDPLDLIKKYGADATRLSLVIGAGPGNDMKLSEDKVRGYKNFANKLWNIARFVLGSAGNVELINSFKDYSTADAKLWSEWQALLGEITDDMEDFRYYLAGEKLYHYAWHKFADDILEESKKVLEKSNTNETISRKQLLLAILGGILRALHPFMPYVTEEIWQEIKKGQSLLMVQKWPI